jgi:hypothetical protein
MMLGVSLCQRRGPAPMCRIILVDQRLELDAELDQFDVDAPECVVAAGHLVVPLRGRGYSIDCSPRFWLNFILRSRCEGCIA